MTFKCRPFVVLSMHIAMVSGEYPPRWGGIGSVVYHLAGHLAQRGHDVTIITRTHKQPTPQQPGVSVLQVPWLKAPMAFTRSYGKHALTELRRLHQVKPVDVVHTLLPLGQLDRQGIPLGGGTHRAGGVGAQRKLDR